MTETNAKPDAPQIRHFLAELLDEEWIKSTECRSWPRFAFHYTDIRNAVAILQDGKLLSRSRMEAANQLAVSSGSSEVLAFTDGDIKDYVRLYFRPKTPTQYYAEGVKSKESLKQSRFPDAHCPVPVFLLFDLAEVLSLPASRFSDKGLGSHRYHIYATADELRALNWRDIYNNGPLAAATDATKRRDTIAARNAEIIVPGALDLAHLKFIYCRSQAELETLAHLLPKPLCDKLRPKMFSSARQNLYERLHTFVETARLTRNSVTLNFSPDTSSPGPYHLVYRFSAINGAILRSVEIDNFMVRSPEGHFSFHIPAPAQEYEVEVVLDSALIYAGIYQPTDGPY